jgi:hypothetical protein
MSGGAARRNRQWWQRDGLEADLPAAHGEEIPDPWVGFVSDQHAALSDEQRSFLIGDLDQPVVPRLRTIDIELDIDIDVDFDADRAEPLVVGVAEGVERSARPGRSRGTAGGSTGNATGKRPGDRKSIDPYGQPS